MLLLRNMIFDRSSLSCLKERGGDARTTHLFTPIEKWESAMARFKSLVPQESEKNDGIVGAERFHWTLTPVTLAGLDLRRR
jgi:hypothetical protein